MEHMSYMRTGTQLKHCGKYAYFFGWFNISNRCFDAWCPSALLPSISNSLCYDRRLRLERYYTGRDCTGSDASTTKLPSCDTL